MTKYDGGKFVWSELFSNENGKSSGSGFIGIIGSLFCMGVVVIGIIIYIITLFVSPKQPEIIQVISNTVMAVIGLAGLYAGLLGLRKWKSNKVVDNSTDETLIETTEETKTTEETSIETSNINNNEPPKEGVN